ncbi:hypothetical protein D9619_011185 [Psilocybe cf. subviscida]|uniref:SWIM-type domain-containing protein n=1 Tax=Psilocybe cf. subviscida TaxID=2480587 RepID=A0A8H5BJ62_9AGAR|nr:hypothetical protein D9619_011185 [Psilocybe cf. subviscida]
MPRCDLLVWILVSKLASTYYSKLTNLLTSTGRYRELCSWRKDFKREWKKLEKRDITLPINDAYRPNVRKWICTCPAFVTSRFLICKHLIQLVDRVPPKFFLEVKRHRSTPFWRHENLKASNEVQGTEADARVRSDRTGAEGNMDDEDDFPFDEDEGDVSNDEEEMMGMVEGRTFTKALTDDIDLITEFLAGLKFQLEFRDQRFLNVLEKEGAGFLRLAKLCVEKENRMKRTTGAAPSTWDKSSLTTMFYRPRPTGSDST